MLRREVRGPLAFSLVWILIVGAFVVLYLTSSSADGGPYLWLAMLSTPVALYNVGRYLGRYRALRRLSRLAGLRHPATRMWMTTWSESRWIPMVPIGKVIPAGEPGAEHWVALSAAPDTAPVLCVRLLSGRGLIPTTGPEPVDVLGTTRPRERIVIRRSSGEMLWPDGRAKGHTVAKRGGAFTTAQCRAAAREF